MQMLRGQECIFQTESNAAHQACSRPPGSLQCFR